MGVLFQIWWSGKAVVGNKVRFTQRPGWRTSQLSIWERAFWAERSVNTEALRTECAWKQGGIGKQIRGRGC